MEKKRRGKGRIVHDYNSRLSVGHVSVIKVSENQPMPRMSSKAGRSKEAAECFGSLTSAQASVHIGRVVSNGGATIEASPAEFAEEEFTSSRFVEFGKTALPYQGKSVAATMSCTSSDSDYSPSQGGSIGNRNVQHFSRGSGDVAEKRKRIEDLDGYATREEEDEQDSRKSSRLSEGERVWQYVCRRSVFVSPPLPVQAPPVDNSPAVSDTISRKHTKTPFVGFGRFFENPNVYSGKTTRLEVAVLGAMVNVTLTRESAVTRKWIERQTGTRFGLDLEWQPNYRKGEKENKVALLQISSETECLLVQMLLLDSIPNALVEFLKDPRRLKAGVGINTDIQKLARDHGLVSQGAVELTTLAVEQLKNAELKRAGLKVLAKKVLGFDMNKPKSVTMSNWSRSHLDCKQVEYACMDAWVSFAIFCKLQKPATSIHS